MHCVYSWCYHNIKLTTFVHSVIVWAFCRFTMGRVPDCPRCEVATLRVSVRLHCLLDDNFDHSVCRPCSHDSLCPGVHYMCVIAEGLGCPHRPAHVARYGHFSDACAPFCSTWKGCSTAFHKLAMVSCERLLLLRCVSLRSRPARRLCNSIDCTSHGLIKLILVCWRPEAQFILLRAANL